MKKAQLNKQKGIITDYQHHKQNQKTISNTIKKAKQINGDK